MRLATWNVNSVRSRIDRVEALLQRHDIDVLALQETKCTEEQFPAMGLESLGYEVAARGYDQWNGVALISRIGLEDIERGFEGMPTFGKGGADPKAEARATGATCGGVRVWSLYVPNGRKPDDEHYDYKLRWLSALHDQAESWAAAGPTALVGDWNIAPLDSDVFDIRQFARSTHVTPREREAFAAFTDGAYADVVRPILPDAETYTYWDYYRQRFERNRGMRIDYVLAGGGLAERVTGAFIDTEERGGEDGHGKGASDHAPVIVDVDA